MSAIPRLCTNGYQYVIILVNLKGVFGGIVYDNKN